ncbi:DUF1294 domain-containing protein [Caulobacter soli]|uniref:DUF1294 domain-containing protein n=1 Tax=Caulobacter soli TaxID=2708539 RepID=UPI001FE4D2EC|nr:DUF1294 domain-containing protein [Caulobacter soli]
MITFLGVYLGVLNLLTFTIFGFDKAAAADRRSRVPERVLLSLAALGGSPGALLARPVFRHKTRKQPFSAWLVLIVFVQVAALVAGLALWWARHGDR